MYTVNLNLTYILHICVNLSLATTYLYEHHVLVNRQRIGKKSLYPLIKV